MYTWFQCCLRCCFLWWFESRAHLAFSNNIKANIRITGYYCNLFRMLGTWHSFCLQSICTALTVTVIIFIISHVHLWRLIFQSLILKMPSSLSHQVVLSVERFNTSRQIFLLLEYITLMCVCVCMWSLAICAACVYNCSASSSGVFHMFCVWRTMSAASVSTLLEWGTPMNMLTLWGEEHILHAQAPKSRTFDLLFVQSLCKMH